VLQALETALVSFGHEALFHRFTHRVGQAIQSHAVGRTLANCSSPEAGLHLVDIAHRRALHLALNSRSGISEKRFIETDRGLGNLMFINSLLSRI
jgi:hypothetical protein